MEPEISPEQKEQLTTWAGQRDALLLEISQLQATKDVLERKNKEKADAYTEIEVQMNQVLGRIDELQKKEAELPLLISREVAQLESQKTTLESEVMSLKNLIEPLVTQKESLEKDIVFALSVFKELKDETFALDKIVDHVTRVSADNVNKIDALVAGLNKSLEEIIAVNRKNVYETNVVIEKVPAMLMELQKHGLVSNKI